MISDMTTDELVDELVYYKNAIDAALADNNMDEYRRLTDACEPYGAEYLRRVS